MFITNDKKLTLSFMLSDGNEYPLLGFGTSSVAKDDTDDTGFQAIVNSIKSGYRLIDTAAAYQNEEGVGSAIQYCIKEGIVKREDLYVCTKLWCTAHRQESVVEACRQSLRRLKLEYIDLYLIHWPFAFAEDGHPIKPLDEAGKLRYTDTSIIETWRGMEDVRDAGLARSIGVSNFNHKMISEILQNCKHRPTVNQVECHPYLSQLKLQEYSRKNGILLAGYCPLGSPSRLAKPGQPTVLKDPVLLDLAAKYKKSPAQIVLKYLVQRKIPPIPKSVTLSRIEENLDIFDFELSREDMKSILSLNKDVRYCPHTLGEDLSDHPLYPFHEDY